MNIQIQTKFLIICSLLSMFFHLAAIEISPVTKDAEGQEKVTAGQEPEKAPQEKTFIKSEEPPYISTDKETIDFGDLLEGENNTQKLIITNKGKGDLTLLKIDFTCGCTIPQIVFPSGEVVIPDRKKQTKIGVLKSGESAKMDIEFKAQGYMGKIKRRLSIFSNDPQFREKQILIEAMVKPAFEITPKKFAFGTVSRGTEVKKTVEIRSKELDDWKIKTIKDLPEHLSYELEPFEEDGRHCVRATLTLSSEAPIGTKNLKFTAEVENDKVGAMILYAFLDIRPPIIFGKKEGEQGMLQKSRADSIIDFGVLKPKTGAEQVFDILNENPKVPYLITEMEFTSRHQDFIDVELITKEKGVSYQIKVSVKPEITARFFRGNIKLTSEHPDIQMKEIFIKGWVSKE